MKMSDHIKLPVEHNGLDLFDSDGLHVASDRELDAAAHAINKHDELVEGLKLAVADMETWMQVHGPSDPTSELITKLQGLISDENTG